MRRLSSSKMTSIWVAIAALCLSAAPVNAALILSGGGLLLVEEGPVAAAAGDPAPPNLATGAVPFALDELGLATHFISNLNNGTYGNASSWIGNGETGTSGPFVGINLGATPISVAGFAFGRSNVLSGDPCGGPCTDRWAGLYTLQFTTTPNPDATTPDAAWSTIGTLDYVSPGGPLFTKPSVRHRYNFDAVNATGIRMIVPATGLATGTAIDEIELYATQLPPPPMPSPVVLTPQSGFGISFDGNNGVHFDANDPALVPDNPALASNGTRAFGSSELDFGVHYIPNVNDGQYGNRNSWISNFTIPDPNPFIGLSFDQMLPLTHIAFGRDNGNVAGDCCGGSLTDRSIGIYTIQFTQVATPDAVTPDTGDAATGWQTIGTIELTGLMTNSASTRTAAPSTPPASESSSPIRTSPSTKSKSKSSLSPVPSGPASPCSPVSPRHGCVENNPIPR